MEVAPCSCEVRQSDERRINSQHVFRFSFGIERTGNLMYPKLQLPQKFCSDISHLGIKLTFKHAFYEISSG
jgi:hypothetical protein